MHGGECTESMHMCVHVYMHVICVVMSRDRVRRTLRARTIAPSISSCIEDVFVWDEQIQSCCVRPRPDAKGCQQVLKKATEAAGSVRRLQSERERDMCERRKSRTEATETRQ